MFLPIFVNAEECDINKISVSTITLEEKSSNVEELSSASVSGKDINLNLSMIDVGDNALYSFIVKNESNEDYELDLNSLNLSSEYMDYIISTEDNSNIVKANSSKIVHLRVEYKNEVPDNVFSSGIFQDNNTMVVNLSTGENISVPNTYINANIVSILVIAFIMIISIIMLKKNNIKYMILIIGLLSIIPISINAICKCELLITSTIQINKPKVTGSIYRNNDASVSSGTIESTVKNVYCSKETFNGNLMYDSCEDDYISFETEEECNNSYFNNEYVHSCYSELVYTGVGNYVLDPKSLDSSVFIKHDVKNDEIVNTSLCALIDNEERCLDSNYISSFWGNTPFFLEKVLEIFKNDAHYVDNTRFGSSYVGYSNNHVTIVRNDISGSILMFDDKKVCYSSSWSCQSNKK